MYKVQEEQWEVYDPAATIVVDSVVTSAKAQPYGAMEGSNEHNANDLIFPPGMELEVFISLHI